MNDYSIQLDTMSPGLIGALSLIRIAMLVIVGLSCIACLSLFYLMWKLAENSITTGVFAWTAFYMVIIYLYFILNNKLILIIIVAI